jgi:hypothetical protein
MDIMIKEGFVLLLSIDVLVFVESLLQRYKIFSLRE